MTIKGTPKSTKSSNSKKRTPGKFAVQCGTCFKWRLIPTQEEYEEIRRNFIESPFFCDHIPDISCEDDADIDCDSTRVWVIDKPNLPKTPDGFKREVILRGDFSKTDIHYITPDGKKVRSSTEIAAFLRGNPMYKDLSSADFSFTNPKVNIHSIPSDVERWGSSANKRIKSTASDSSEDC